MRIDPFTYALINNIDPVSGQPLQTGYGPEIYKPNIVQGIPGSGGKSKYLYGARPESNWQYVKAGNQGILDSLFNGIGSNLIVGTISKIGEGVGMVLNIPNAIAANDVTKLFDNGISHWFANLHEEAKEALPIYIGRQYEEGNFIQKLATEEFWFNEGFDAVSFLASAYVPGGLVSKLGLAKQIGNLGARTIGAKAANGLKKLTAKQIESGFTQGFSTVYNTITEAAFEAKDAYENVFNTLKAQYGEEHAKKKASEAAARVFRANVAGLLIPNAIQSSFFHGSNAANLSKIKDLIRADKSVEEVIKNTASVGKEVLKGIASEGLWEENFQGAVQQYETRLANGWSGDMLGEYAYGLMQGLTGTAKLLIPGVKAPAAGTYEDEALTSIALGGLIGGGMGAYSALKDRAQLGEAVTAEQAAWQKIKNANLLGKGLLLDNYTVGLKSFGVTDEVDAEGKPTGKKTTNFVDPATGEVAIDPQKMQDLVLRRTKDMALGAAQLDATLLNNKYMMDLNKEYAMMSYAWHLKSIPGLSKEDIADILKYDLKLPVGNELAGGIGENFLNENIAKIEGYLNLYNATEENASSGYEFSDSESDQRFSQMLRRAYFYDAAKKTAIQNLRRNAPEAVQAQMDQMIESIDAHLKDFKRLIPKFKEIYDTEIEPGIQLQERLKQVNLSLLDKALADDAREELLLERETLAYQLEELIETDNYYPEYFGGMRGAEYASIGMSRNEPAYHSRRRGNQFVPVTKKEGYYFNKAKRTLLDKEVNRDLADPNNNIFDTIDKITRDDYSGLPLEDTTVTNLSTTLAREKSLFEATATLDDLASIKDSLTELVQVAPESSSENYDEEFQFAAPFIEQAINLLKGEPATPEEMQEIASNPNAFLMLYKDIDASIKAQELTKARFENYEAKLRDYNTNRGNILQELADIDAMSPQERNEYFKFEHFKEKTRGISDTINRAKKDPDNFADSVDREISLASRLINITKSRTDISEDLKNKILSKLSEMIMSLQQIKEFADKNRAKRYEQQRLSEIAYGISLKEILTTPGAILDIIIEVIGETTYNNIIKDIDNYDQKNNPFEGYEAILALVKKNATKEQLDRLSAKLDEQADKQVDIIFDRLSSLIAVVDTGATGILANIKAGLKKFNTQRGEFITNPGSGARKVLMLTDFFVEKKNAPVQQNTPLNPYQVFNLDLDFTTLYYNLQGKDIPKTERDIIETLWDLNLRSRAYHTIAASTEGTLDAVELYKFESAAIEEDKKFPTVQQALSFREAIKQLLAPKASGAFGVSAVFGIFGSGKTAMIAKKALHFLVPKDKRKEKILAFAQSERTSQKIADSVGGTATTFDNFLSMTEAQLAGVDFLVVDEAFVLDSDQIINIKNHAVQNKIKVLFLGDPSQNRAEDIITLRQDITTAQPLTVVLRTNNPAITKFSKEFQYNPTKVESVVAEATSSVSEMNETSSGVFVTEPGQDPMQQIINLAKNPNGKSKLIITNNPQRKIQYENALAGTDVRVVSPKEAQGDEASEVYMDLDRSGQDVNGGAIANEYVFNTMVATSASRAIDKLIVARNSSFVVTPVVQTSLHDAIADLKDEFNKYQEDYTRSLLAYKHFYEKYLGVTLTTPKKEPNQPEPDPKEPDTNPEPPAGPKPPKEEGDIVLQNPEGINASKVRPGQGFVVRAVVSGGRVADERWVVMAPAKDSDGYVVAGVLGAEEIQSDTFTPEQQKRAANIGELFRLSTERKVVYSYENFEANIIRPVNVKYAKPLWFNFGEAKKATKTYIQSLMQKFFFDEGVSIEGDVTTNLRIYNQDTEAGEFSPKKGVPYVVISGYNVPQKKGFKFPGNLHIILIPPKLRKDSNHIKDLTAVKGAVDELAAKLGKDPITFFNSKEFEDMLDDFARLHSVDTTNIDLPIIQAPGYEDAIGEFQQKHSIPQDAIPALGRLVQMVYGPEKSNLTIKESEFEQWKKDNPNKQDAQWERIEYRSEKKRKEAKEKGEISDIGYITYLEKTSTGKEYRATVTKTILSLNEGKASKAWSAVAAANADIAGYNPRVLMYKAGSSMKHKILKKHTKSFIGHRSSNRLAYTHIKDIFNQFAKQAEAIANDMGPGHPNYENMKDLYVQLYKWGHSKYGRDEYLKVLERIKYLTGETEEYRDNAERPEWMPFFSLGVMDERGERDVTIEEFLEYKSTKPVPYSALQALTEDANYTPEGHSQNYYTNVSLNEGNIEMDGESIAYDSAKFDELGFTTTVQSITPAEVVVNYGTQAAQEPQEEETEERSEEELSDIEQQAEQLIADILPYRPGFSRQDIINYVKQKTGKNNPSQEWLDFLAESLERYQRESEFIAEEDDADYFGKNKTIFEDTVPGTIQSLEWARATLKKILPGLDLDRQVEFLDELQMHVYEEEGQEVLGRVFNAIMKLRTIENKGVYDQVVYHEAFHMAWRYLFSEGTKKRLKAAFKAVYGKEMTDYETIEGLAELYQRYEQRQNIKKSWLRKLIEDIRGFFDAVYRHRMYIEDTFFNLDRGKYAAVPKANLKEGSPDNLSFVKTNFGSRQLYLNAVEHIRRRIIAYTREGTKVHFDRTKRATVLPMTRDEIFDAIYSELVRDEQNARDDADQFRSVITRLYGVNSIAELKEKMRGLEKLLSDMLKDENKDLDLYDSKKKEYTDIVAKFNLYKNLLDKRKMYKTLISMNLKTKNYIFDEVVENIYPSFRTSDRYNFEIDTLSEEEAEAMSEQDKEMLAEMGVDTDTPTALAEDFNAIRAETVDHAKINWASKQSLALKDFFSFVPLYERDTDKIKKDKNGKDIIINPKIAYVRALQIITQLNLNSPNLSEELAYYRRTNFINSWDYSILWALERLVGDVNQLEDMSGVWSIIPQTYDLTNKVDFHFFYDREGSSIHDVDGLPIHSHALNYKDVLALQKKFPNRYRLIKATDNSLISLYQQVLADPTLPDPTPEQFSAVYKGRESVNTLANIQSFMGSLKDTDYRISQKSIKGKSKTINLVTARSSDRHINNRAIIQEAFRDDFEKEEPLIKQHNKIKQILNYLQSEKIDDKAQGINILLKHLGIARDFTVDKKVLTRASSALITLIKTLENSSTFPVIQVSYMDTNGVEQSTDQWDLDSWFVANNAGFGALVNVIGREDPQPRGTTIISVLKQKIYKHTLTNPIYKAIGEVINFQERTIGNAKESLRRLPEYFEPFKEINPFLKINPANNKPVLRLHDIFEIDGHKDKYGAREYGSGFLSMDKKKFNTMQFSSMFLANLGKQEYEQLFYQQADKPRPIGATVDFITDSKLDSLVPILLENANYYLDPQREGYFKMHNKSHASGKLVNGALIQTALQNATREDGAISVDAFKANLRELFAREAVKLAKNLVESKVDIFGNASQLEALNAILGNKGTNTRTANIERLNVELQAQGVNTIDDFSALPENAGKGGQYSATVPQLAPYAYAYMMNYYINGYFMNQLVNTSSQFFGNGKTVIKRMTGAAGPGHVGYIHDKFGIRKKFRTLVVGDDATSADTIFSQVLKATLRNPLDQFPELKEVENAKQLKETYDNLQAAELVTIDDIIAFQTTIAELRGDNIKTIEDLKESLEVLKKFFGTGGIDRTDGQVFITPRRLAELQRGYGREFRLANILKPKYFGPRTEQVQTGTTETGEPIFETLVIPTYIKPSAVVLSDELLYQKELDENGNRIIRPGMEVLAKLRAKMENNNIDELAFGSAVKLGKPKDTISWNELLESEDGTTITKGILSLNSEHYGIQLNPRAKVDSTTALFTQLLYFLNIYSSSPKLNNIDKANLVYSAVAFLFEKGGKLFKEKLDRPGGLAAELKKSFSERGDELIFADLLEEGISPTSPIFEKKTMIKLASMMERLAIKIRLPGGKLVLQTDAGITNPQTGKPLRFKTTSEGKFVAEVIVPKGMLPEDIEKEILKGNNVFDNPILMGFRIPSTELHSAVSMEVVGFYEDGANTNMVIAPELLVALHGSDFDVDSLFIAKRPIAKETIQTSSREAIETLMDLASDLEGTLALPDIKENPLYNELLEAYEKIRKGVGSESESLTAEEYNDIMTPRVAIEIENDFQEFAKRGRFNLSDPQSNLAARRLFAQKNGLGWLDRLSANQPINAAESAQSSDENVIMNSRKWTILSGATYAIYDMRRILYNLSKNPEAMQAAPAVQKKLNRFVSQLSMESAFPEETFIKEGDIIGFVKDDRGKYILNPHYDKIISRKIEEIKELREKVRKSGYKQIDKLLSKQYNQLLELKEEYYKATIVETFLDTISDPKNAERMTRPISKSYLVEKEGKDKDGNPMYAPGSAMYEVDQRGLVDKHDPDLSNYNDAYDAFKSVADMQRLTGIFANTIKVLSYLNRASTAADKRQGAKQLSLITMYREALADLKKADDAAKLKKAQTKVDTLRDQVMAILEDEKGSNKAIPALLDEDLQFYFNVGDKSYHITQLNEFVLGTNNKVSIYDILDALVNIAIDNIKDQELFSLQATIETANAYAALVSLGIPASDIINTLYTPIVQQMLNRSRINSKVKLVDTVSRTYNELSTQIKDRLIATLAPEDLKALEDNHIKVKEASVDDILEILPKLEKYKNIRKKFGKQDIIDVMTNPKFNPELNFETSESNPTMLPDMKDMSIEDTLKLYNVISFLKTGVKLGDNITTISKLISPLRDMPANYESIEEYEAAIDDLGQLMENPMDAEALEDADISDRETFLKKLKSLKSIFYTHQSVGYKMGAFFINNPHIYSAYRRIKQLKKTLQDNFPLLAPDAVEALKENYKATGLTNPKSQASIREQLRRYLMTQVVDREFHKLRYNVRIASRRKGKVFTKTVYGMEAWAAKFTETVKKVQASERALALKEGREPNFFLDSLYLDGGQLKFTFDTEPDRIILEDLRKAFSMLKYYTFEGGYKEFAPSYGEVGIVKNSQALQDFDMEYNASEFQKDFLYYVTLYDGMRFSMSNYSAAIPPAMLKKFEKKAIELEKRYSTDENFRKAIAFHSKVEILRENAGLIGSYISVEDEEKFGIREAEEAVEKKVDEQGKEISMPKNGVFTDSSGTKVYYDRAYENPLSVDERAVKELREKVNSRFPMFITRGYDNNIEVYMRVTAVTEDKIAYISIGRPSGAYTKVPDINNMQAVDGNYATNMPTQFVEDVDKETFVTKRKYDYLKPNEPLRLVSYADRSRISPKEVTIVNTEEVYHNYDGQEVPTDYADKKYFVGYRYTVRPYIKVEAGSSVVRINTLEELEQAYNNPNIDAAVIDTQTLLELLLTKTMAYTIVRNKETGKIDHVKAPNGERSRLFESIRIAQPNWSDEQLLREYAKYYTTEFQDKIKEAKRLDSSFDLDLDEKLRNILINLYPEIELAYTNDIINSSENSIYNQLEEQYKEVKTETTNKLNDLLSEVPDNPDSLNETIISTTDEKLVELLRSQNPNANLTHLANNLVAINTPAYRNYEYNKRLYQIQEYKKQLTNRNDVKGLEILSELEKLLTQNKNSFSQNLVDFLNYNTHKALTNSTYNVGTGIFLEFAMGSLPAAMVLTTLAFVAPALSPFFIAGAAASAWGGYSLSKIAYNIIKGISKRKQASNIIKRVDYVTELLNLDILNSIKESLEKTNTDLFHKIWMSDLHELANAKGPQKKWSFSTDDGEIKNRILTLAKLNGSKKIYDDYYDIHEQLEIIDSLILKLENNPIFLKEIEINHRFKALVEEIYTLSDERTGNVEQLTAQNVAENVLVAINSDGSNIQNSDLKRIFIRSGLARNYNDRFSQNLFKEDIVNILMAEEIKIKGNTSAYKMDVLYALGQSLEGLDFKTDDLLRKYLADSVEDATNSLEYFSDYQIANTSFGEILDKINNNDDFRQREFYKSVYRQKNETLFNDKNNFNILQFIKSKFYRTLLNQSGYDSSNIQFQTLESKILGQANIKAMTVLINAIDQKQDTLPHEYAHHYIAWYRHTPIVQEAIAKWGSEEALVQAIGEQVVKQEGEAWTWWKNFVEWILNKFAKLSDVDKETLKNALTDAFLTRTDLNTISKSPLRITVDKKDLDNYNVGKSGSAPKDSTMWLLGKARLSYLQKSKLNPPVVIKTTTVDHQLDSAGTYFPAIDIITLNTTFESSEDVSMHYYELLRSLIHESVHASTNVISVINALLNNPTILNHKKKTERALEILGMNSTELSQKLSNLGYTGTVDEQLREFGTALEDIRASAIENLLSRGVQVSLRDKTYGLSNVAEMFTEFLSNPSFRALAKDIEIPVRGSIQTLFDFILDTIAKLFAGRSAVRQDKTSLYNLLDAFIESDLFSELRIASSTIGFQERLGDMLDLIEERMVPTSGNRFKEDLQKILTAEIQEELGDERLTDYGNDMLRTLVNEAIKHDHTEHKTAEKVDRDQVMSEQVEVTPDEKAYEHKTTKTTYRRVTDTLNGWLSHFLRNPREKEAIKDRADRVWEGYPDDKILFTDLGKLNKADYIEKSTLIERKGILRGRIIHAYLEAYVNGDPKGDLSRKIREMLEETGYKGEDFTWLSNNDKVGGILKHILSKADINSLDNISPEKKDIIRSEMHLFNDILGIAGSTDLIIYHADGSVSFKDIKAGYRHFAPNSGETLLYGDQPASSRLVYNDWDHKARLQVMTYAFLYKLANPDAKIKGMDILWMPDAHAISSPNFRTEVNPEVYLNMIRDMLKDKMPDKLQELELDLIKRLGETEGKKAWANIWNPKSYMVGYSKDLREDMSNKNKDVPVDQQLKAAIEDLRLEIMQGLNPHTFQQATYSSQGHAGNARDERIRKKMKNIIELQKQTTQLDFMTTKEDIGRFQDWLFTASTTNNAYIQMWDEFFMSRRDKYNEEVNILRNKFLSLVRPILEEYLRKHPGKGTLSAITRGTINGVNPRELYAFAYIPVDIDGNQIKNSEEPVAEYILRHKEEHFQDLVNDNVNFPYINSTNIHLYKNLLTFVNETYAGFFKDTETKKALANKPATYTFGKGGIKVPITNLQLHNGKRSTFDKEGARKSDLLFEYKDGFFFKVPPLLEEFGFMNSRWRKIWFQRNLTFTEEHQFEGFDKKAIAEGLPMKYLGSGMRELRNNPELFSMHLEHQFDRATRAYLWKENMDDVFAYGQGIRIMLNVENARGEGENVPERLIQFMKRELDLKLRGRPAGYDKNEDYISKNKYNVNIVKILAKIKYWLNFPLLAGNYVGGSANAAFTTLMTLKQAAQNDVIKRLERGAALPGLNGDEWDFGMKELAASMPDVTNVYIEGMKGDIRNSKVYQLAKRFGYLPNNFDWSTAPNNLITSANRGLSTDILFTFYSLPEEFIAMLVMTAQLKNMKITSGSMAGKSLYDMYEFYDAKDENGNIYKELRWATDPTTGKPYVRAVVNTSADPDNPSYVELTALDGKEVRRLYSAYDRMHGGYRSIDKISLDYTILGQLALQFKRYLPHILRQALASNAYRSNLGYYKVTGALEDGTPTVEWVSKVMEGRWRVLGGSILEGLKVILQTDNVPKDPQSMYDKFRASLAGMSSYKWSELNAGQKEALIDAYTTLLLLGTGVISLLALGGDADDDDPAYRYIARIFNDLTQMYNPLELTKNLVNWSPVSLKKLYDTQRDASTVLLSSLLWLSGSNERAFTREGRLEGFNALMRDIPLGAVYRKTEDFATSDILFGE